MQIQDAWLAAAWKFKRDGSAFPELFWSGSKWTKNLGQAKMYVNKATAVDILGVAAERETAKTRQHTFQAVKIGDLVNFKK